MFAEYTTATAPVSNVRAVGSTRGWVIQMCSFVEIKAVWRLGKSGSGLRTATYDIRKVACTRHQGDRTGRDVLGAVLRQFALKIQTFQLQYL